jgi:hypothetical protein
MFFLSSKHSLFSIVVFWVLLSLVLMSCQEDEVEHSAPRNRGFNVSTPQITTNQIVSNLQPDISGEGPKDVPDWLKNQEVSLLRRYATEQITGYLNGNAFQVKSVHFDWTHDGWVLVLSDIELKNELDLIPSGNRIEILLSGKPGNEYIEQQPLGKSKAEWKILKEVGKSYRWDAQSAYLLEVQDWQVSAFDPNLSAIQKAGVANGRLQVHFKNQAGVQGWVNGKFDQAMVRYLGNPANTN